MEEHENVIICDDDNINDKNSLQSDKVIEFSFLNKRWILTKDHIRRFNPLR